MGNYIYIFMCMFSSEYIPVFNLPPNSFHSNNYYAYKAAKDLSKSCRFTSYAQLEEEAAAEIKLRRVIQSQ